MPCPICVPVSPKEFSAEMMVHFRGMENLDRPGVMIFPKVLVCLNCGCSQFNAPETELALLGKLIRRLAVLRGRTADKRVCREDFYQRGEQVVSGPRFDDVA
jgi:hypothetical protein